LFGRTKNPAQSVETTPVKDGGKGRPTPSRKEAEAAARARAKVPRTRKEQLQAQRANRGESSKRVREGMKAGEEKYLPARDKGPARRFVRDFVDAQWSLVELMVPVLIVAMVMGYSGSSGARAVSSMMLMVLFVIVIFEMLILRFRVRRELTRRFPDESLKGTTYYALVRAMQVRFLRLPKPQVKRGQKLADTYR
jgi:hypothetical protein